MIVGLGYFVYFVWQMITEVINPAIDSMKATIIRLTDQLRLLDQDMIRLQQKVNTVLEIKENEEKFINPSDTNNDSDSNGDST
jgi:prefoldin subunit 5